MEISILPLDVGFDPKNTGHPILLPNDWQSTEDFAVKHLDADGKQARATGDREAVKNILKAAGYKVGE